MQVLLVHNPTAGDARPNADDLCNILADAGFQVRYQSTKKNWRKALQESTGLVVAAGGDGTVGKVMRELSGTDRPMAVLPLGTANNIARALAISGDAREIVASWKDAETQPFDIGVVSAQDGERRFVEAAGGGIFAAAMAEGKQAIDNATAIVGNEIDRAIVFIMRLFETAAAEPWRVTIDGKDFSGDYLTVEAMNIRYSGPSIPLAPDADPTDGQLDVVLVEDRHREGLLLYLQQRLAHQAVSQPKVTVRSGRHVRLAPTQSPMRIDDSHIEEIGEWDIVIKPGAIRLLWPPPQAQRSSAS